MMYGGLAGVDGTQGQVWLEQVVCVIPDSNVSLNGNRVVQHSRC